MALARSLLKMEISMKASFIMAFFMVEVNLFGLMEYSIKDNLPITELLAKVFINGPMEVFIKEKLKMASGME